MSIMISGLECSTSPGRQPGVAVLDDALTGLLDHIAVELAEEYVRMMEVAASAEIASPDEAQP